MQPASPPAGHRRALTSCPSPGLSAALRMCITTHHRPMSRVDLQIFYGPLRVLKGVRVSGPALARPATAGSDRLPVVAVPAASRSTRTPIIGGR